ncbi:glycosyltransferase [Parasynechococcus sp.]|uniref:glycosyltransferase n=1 Tax=Parasynechococcus sp. TaxID=3101203 RepID=UPI0037041979
MRRDIVLVSTAEWHHPFWTNKQHTALALARQGCRILYVDSLGLRKPSANSRDLFRIGRRLLRGLRLPEQVHEGIWVCSPLVIPAARWGLIQRCNKLILRLYLYICQFYLRFKSPMLWTYNPLALRLVNSRNYSKLIYHCVDDIAAQPGMDSPQIIVWERLLCESADIVFVTSKNLLDARIEWNPATYYYPNVIDLSYFNSVVQGKAVDPPSSLARIPGPRLLFVGAISSYKVNFDLLRDLAVLRPQWSIVLIGAIGEGDPQTDIRLLADLSNVYYLGPKAYSDLLSYMVCCDIGLLPCRLNQYTSNMFPMKFLEYLASGLPVVSTVLPSLSEYRSFYDECKSASDFVDAIERILTGKTIFDHRAVHDLLISHTYESRTVKMLKKIDGVHEG